MSQANNDNCEPNLIPMLDLVLQMVMFFMLCTNFIMEDVNGAIKLPSAIQAKPLDKAEEYVIFLNVNDKGHVVLSRSQVTVDPSNDPNTLTNRDQVRNYMRQKHDRDEDRREQFRKKGVADDKLPKYSLVVLRADENCIYQHINDVLLGCREAKYTDIQLRAKVQSATK